MHPNHNPSFVMERTPVQCACLGKVVRNVCGGGKGSCIFLRVEPMFPLLNVHHLSL